MSQETVTPILLPEQANRLFPQGKMRRGRVHVPSPTETLIGVEPTPVNTELTQGLPSAEERALAAVNTGKDKYVLDQNERCIVPEDKTFAFLRPLPLADDAVTGQHEYRLERISKWFNASLEGIAGAIGHPLHLLHNREELKEYIPWAFTNLVRGDAIRMYDKLHAQVRKGTVSHGDLGYLQYRLESIMRHIIHPHKTRKIPGALVTLGSFSTGASKLFDTINALRDAGHPVENADRFPTLAAAYILNNSPIPTPFIDGPFVEPALERRADAENVLTMDEIYQTMISSDESVETQRAKTVYTHVLSQLVRDEYDGQHDLYASFVEATKRLEGMRPRRLHRELEGETRLLHARQLVESVKAARAWATTHPVQG